MTPLPHQRPRSRPKPSLAARLGGLVMGGIAVLVALVFFLGSFI